MKTGGLKMNKKEGEGRWLNDRRVREKKERGGNDEREKRVYCASPSGSIGRMQWRTLRLVNPQRERKG